MIELVKGDEKRIFDDNSKEAALRGGWKVVKNEKLIGKKTVKKAIFKKDL